MILKKKELSAIAIASLGVKSGLLTQVGIIDWHRAEGWPGLLIKFCENLPVRLSSLIFREIVAEIMLLNKVIEHGTAGLQSFGSQRDVPVMLGQNL